MQELLFNETHRYAMILVQAKILLDREDKLSKTEHQLNSRLFNNAFCGMIRNGYPFSKIEETGMEKLVIDDVEYMCPDSSVKNILRDEYEKVMSGRHDAPAQPAPTSADNTKTTESADSGKTEKPAEQEKQTQLKTEKPADKKSSEKINGAQKQENKINADGQTHAKPSGQAAFTIDVPQGETVLLNKQNVREEKHRNEGGQQNIQNTQNNSGYETQLSKQKTEGMRSQIVPDIPDIDFDVEDEKENETFVLPQAPDTREPETEDFPEKQENSRNEEQKEVPTEEAASEKPNYVNKLFKNKSGSKPAAPAVDKMFMPDTVTPVEFPQNNVRTDIADDNPDNISDSEGDSDMKDESEQKQGGFKSFFGKKSKKEKDKEPEEQKETVEEQPVDAETNRNNQNIRQDGSVFNTDLQPNAADDLTQNEVKRNPARENEPANTPALQEPPKGLFKPKTKKIENTEMEPVVPEKNIGSDATKTIFTEVEPKRDYTHDGGELMLHTHNITLQKKFGQGTDGPYRFIFWPIFIPERNDGRVFGHFLLHVTSPEGNEEIFVTNGKETTINFTINDKEFQAYTIWNNGVWQTFVLIKGKTDSMYDIHEERDDMVPPEANRDSFLDQFRLARKGQPKHFVVPFKNNNRGEMNIPIVGYVEVSGVRHILARMDNNELRYKTGGNEKVIQGHWENGKFTFTVENAKLF